MLAQENVALIAGPTTPTTSHSYSTRIRSNSSIKPPARLCQASETPLQPRKIRPNAPVQQKVAVATPAPTTKAPPLPAGTPEFPPPHVTLHPDDSSSKVFIAIGRSFLSVDNRAMTIKDLAEMTLKYGLMCQNVSAAGQAITTYIRNHMQRCETEQDHPLLSRHVLSGTPSDDDLAPALHSRSGGAHCALSPGDARSTNFRRGTLVWFLSRAAGAPCPFSRAGIRLSEYTEDGKVGATANGPRDRKRERDRRRRAQASAQLCGQKRKRLSRGCKAEDAADTEEEPDPDPRPPKVKLTLRLRPSLVHSSSSSNSPSVTPSLSASPAPTPVAVSTPPVSRETSESPDEDYVASSSDESDSGEESEDDMSVDDDSDSDSDSEASSDSGLYANPPDSAFFRMPSPSSFALRHSRSPSVASPPPDSDVDLAHVDDDDDDMFSWSADEDEQVQPKQVIDLTVVKEEVDEDAISSMLAAWDTRDLAQSSAAVVEAVTAAAAKASEQEAAAAAALLVPKAEDVYIKREEIDTWDFADFGAPAAASSAVAEEDEEEQQEEWEESVVFSPVDELGAMRWGSASTSSWDPQTPADSGRRFSDSFAIASSSAPAPVAKGRRMSELLWQDAEILGLETITAKELEEGEWTPTATLATGARRSAFAARQPVMPAHPTNVFPPTPTTATFSNPHPPLHPPSELSGPASAPSPSAISDVSQDEPGPSTPPPPAHTALPAVWSASPAEGSAPFNFGFGNRRFEVESEPGSARASVQAKTRATSPVGHHELEMDVDMGEEDEVARSAELLRLVPPLPPPSVVPEDADPLSPAEEAVFAQLCAVPDFDAPHPSRPSSPLTPSPSQTDAVMPVGEMDEHEAEETADVGEVERPLALRRSRRVEAAKKEAEKKAKTAARKGRTAKKRA